jgi:DNA-binding response OmpR family regulator
MHLTPSNAGEGCCGERGVRARSLPTILVIEPSLTLRTLVSLVLHRAGYARVSVYPDALPALRHLMRGCIAPPALALFTKRSPGGYRALQLLKQSAPATAVVVVMDDEGCLERIKARVAGASAVLIKPYWVEELLRLVRLYAPG